MRIGLWGCGQMGANLAEGLDGITEASLVVVFDLDRDAAAAVASRRGAAAVNSAEELFAWDGLDGVMIALPSDMHAPAAVRAADAGVHVFVEKPMSVDVKSCRDMIDAARRNGVKLMVGQVLRYYEPYRSILRCISDGRFGALRAAAICRRTKALKAGASGWRLDRRRSGGLLFEVGIHELDMLRCLLGRPASVRSLSSRASDTENAVDFLSVQIRFASGGVATYETGLGDHSGCYGFRLYFEKATMISHSVFDTSALALHTADGTCELDLEAEWSKEPPVEAELRGWLSAVRGKASVPVTGEDGLASVALAEAAYRSVDLDEATVEYST